MVYSVYAETATGTPPLVKKSLSRVRSVTGSFAPATFDGWNKFFGPTGWTQGNSFVFYSVETLSTKDVLEVDGVKYNVTGSAKGRVRNTYFMVKYV